MPEGVTIYNAYAPKGLDRDCRMWNTVAVTPGRLRSLGSVGVKEQVTESRGALADATVIGNSCSKYRLYILFLTVSQKD